MIGQYVKIQPNELLSGWMHHLAIINGVNDGDFSKYILGVQRKAPLTNGCISNFEGHIPAIVNRIGEDKAPGLSDMLRNHMTFTEGFPFTCSAKQTELVGRYLISPASPDAFLFSCYWQVMRSLRQRLMPDTEDASAISAARRKIIRLRRAA